MARAIKFVIVAVCLLCILAICIAPLVDLPATSLRSYQAVVILLSTLIGAAFFLLALRPGLGLRTTSSSLVRPKIRWRVDAPMKMSAILRC
jgi:hypothetical protein